METRIPVLSHSNRVRWKKQRSENIPIGERARDVYYTFTFDSEGDEMKLDKVLEKFDSYMSPKKNITYMRYRFFSNNQGDEQSTDGIRN